MRLLTHFYCMNSSVIIIKKSFFFFQKHAELISKIREDHDSTVSRMKEQIQDLEVRLEEAVQRARQECSNPSVQSNPEDQQQESDGDELKAALTKCETVVIPELRDKLKKCQQERDSVKNSLIEVEIAKHQGEEGALQREAELRMKITQLNTEKETLEVTLKLRDNELKNRKEESRQERERAEQDLQGVRGEIVTQSEEISSLQVNSGNFNFLVQFWFSINLNLDLFIITEQQMKRLCSV